MVEYAHPGIGPSTDAWTVRRRVRQSVGDRSYGLEPNFAGTVA